ncbi:3-deoxy-D-manno-octulosonic acid kinase [Aestuariibacter sp. A3R04]|uniref:3-deoxy-D-manno-octulosonic acid kinase n=1 Tax=Aestuariibacter sp. A3R04 TaxID=2841571 RepID=UPI001C08F35B|nr:3-deoxy-D-manno-octulosonic acid kinase [Aestuariibacter sp. A3R04]MBU3023852.1 3-deoxy-D-manno-octulosonic acid kinase [Aestuariibacter sp. A3R04]
MANLPQIQVTMTIKQVFISPRHHLLVDKGRFPDVTLSWFSPEYWHGKNAVTGQAKGRGTTLFVREGEHDLVLRHYKRGGLPGKILSDQYVFAGLENTRPVKEFRLLHAMVQKGLNVPQPVAVHVERRGLIYRGDLITSLIPQSSDLHAMLCREPLSAPLWHAIGKAVGKMQSANVFHRDLNARNIMIDKQHTIWIIDFDHCEFRANGPWKQRNVERFLRSLKKEKAKAATFHWNSDDWSAFLGGLRGE